VPKKLLSDYPRGIRNGFVCWWFSAPDTLPIAPALPVPLLFAGRSVPVSLLGFPPRPGPRRLPALLTAIALPRMSRPKVLLTSFEQTPPGPCPAHQPFPSAALLIFGMACRTLGRAQGRSLLPEALPRRGLHSSPGRSRFFRSVRNQQLYRTDRILAGARFRGVLNFLAIAADPSGCIGARGGASVGPEPELQ
jgi:hypothetical protein